jgi:hypothetical protein
VFSPIAVRSRHKQELADNRRNRSTLGQSGSCSASLS